VPVPVIKTSAAQKKGIEELLKAIRNNIRQSTGNKRHLWLLAEKAFQLIEQKRMKNVSKEDLKDKITAEGNAFNLYQFIKKY
ncbi:MAG: methylmalonyl Co-A mutase-associated GTPase MeaB, partial [Bacteroidota bacterium]